MELAKRRHQVFVYASDKVDLTSENSVKDSHVTSNGVSVYYSKTALRSKTFIVTPNMIYVAAKNLSKYDILHIHDCRSFQGICVYVFARVKGVPYVFQPHGSYLPSFSKFSNKAITKMLLDKLICDRIVREASKILALNQVEAKLYKDFGVESKKIVILPNGLDIERYVSLPSAGSFKRNIGISEDEKIILYVGRLHESKGLELLVRAFSIVASKESKVKLVMIGPDDGYKRKLVDLIASLKLNEKVVLTGYVDREVKMAALVDSHLFVTPSFYGFPITFLEACIAGVPLVTTNLGDSLDWINGKVGIVSSSDKNDLANALRTLISDQELHDKYSRNGKSLITSKFSLGKVVDELEQIYSTVVFKRAIKIQ